MKVLKDAGMFGLESDKNMGGLGLNAYKHSRLVTKLGSVSPNLAVTVMVPNSLGPAKLIKEYGTQEQKDKYLGAIAKGDLIPCFGLTELRAGSDAGSIQSTGVVFEEDGKKYLKINAKKRYITLAPIADLVGLAVKVEDPDNFVDKEGITLLLLDRGEKGLGLGKRHKPLNEVFFNGTVECENVIVPLDSIVGREDNIGKGWSMIIKALAAGRGISLPAMAVASSSTTTLYVGMYSRIREQFKIPIAEMEGIQEKLGKMVGNTYMIMAAQDLMGQILNYGEKPSVLSAIMKYQLTERGRQVVNDGMDIVGGSAICKGPMNQIEKFYGGIPVGITVEGSNIVTRSLMVYGQGLMKSHPYLYNVVKSLQENNELDFNKHLITLMISDHAKKVLKLPFYGAVKMIGTYESRLLSLQNKFSLLSEWSLSLGSKLKKSEMLSGRMADALSSLYLAHACLWANKDEKAKSVAVEMLLKEAEQNMYDACDNFPSWALGFSFKIMLFPFGTSEKGPSDKLLRNASYLVTKKGFYISDLKDRIHMTEEMKLLEKAFRNKLKGTTDVDLEDKLFSVGEYDMNLNELKLP